MTTADVAYDTLAEVYEWLVPEPLLTPEGAADAFASVVGHLPAGGRVLDCAAGTGQLAVGLALRGFDATASDASPAMVERARALAAERRVGLPAVTCDWASLGQQGWQEPFDAVFCVGNSIAHAGPAGSRRAALSAMAGVLCDGGVLALTSRNWDLIRAEGPGLRVADRLTRRADRKGLVLYSWELSDSAERPHHVDVAVALGTCGLDRVGGRTELVRGDVCDGLRLTSGVRGMPCCPTQVSGRAHRLAARRSSPHHLDLTTHPGAGVLDRFTWSWVASPS